MTGAARPAAAVAEPEHERQHEPDEPDTDGKPERLRDEPGDATRDAAGRDRSEGAAEDRAQDGRREENDEEQHRQHPAEALRPVPVLLGLGQGLAVDDGDHALDAGRDAAREVALAESRRDGLVDDAVGDEVRERALEPAADLDAKRAVLHRDEEQRAVVRLLAAELPRVDHADRVLLDRLGRCGRHDQHRDLRAFPRLERGELFLERRAFRRRQRAGLVRDARLERRHGLQCLRAGRRHRSGDGHEPRRGHRGDAEGDGEGDAHLHIRERDAHLCEYEGARPLRRPSGRGLGCRRFSRLRGWRREIHGRAAARSRPRSRP